MSAWRDYIEQTKDAAEALVGGLRGERPLTPMILLDTAEGVVGIGVSRRFFDTPADRTTLVGLLLGLVNQYGATRVAWILDAQLDLLLDDASHQNFEAIVVCCIDREASEVWSARLHRFGSSATTGVWTSWPPNETHGDLLTPLQEGLR